MIIRKFEEIVSRHSQRPAVVTPTGPLSYAELNRRANGVARSILAHWPAAAREHTLALFFEHGSEMITAILGAMKAGKTYVPLTVDYPAARLAYMLEHSGSQLVLTDAAHAERARALGREAGVAVLEIHAADIAVEENPGIHRPAEAPAYILYTSGSTGRPKGVMQNLGNVWYYTRNWTERLAITCADRLTLFSSFCHDGSVQDMFGALLNGAAVYPYHVRNRENSGELSTFLQQEEITIWHSVPSLFSYFVNTLNGGRLELPCLRFILLGGEPLREHEINMARTHFPGAVLGNIYGQTESSVNTIWLIGPNEPFRRVILGRPLDETRIFLLGQEGAEVEEYEVGEILVASRYISPGYWRDPEISQQTFRDDEELGRLYWTGDLGRLLPGGEVEFMGRRDFQIKIRGFRVELGEVETAMLKHPDVHEAVVSAREDKAGDKYLAAHYTAAREPGTQELREFLGALLPDYMVPTAFMKLDKLPLTPNGKVDRKALPTPVAGGGTPFAAPRTPLEEGLAAVWADVLGRDPGTIGIDDNFFDLGGHSLKAVMIVSRIHKELGVVVLLADLLQHPTIRELSAMVQGDDQSMPQPRPVSPQEYYPVSFHQRRMWYLHQMYPDNASYRLSGAVPLEAAVNEEWIEQILQLLAARHESLRTYFLERQGEPVQCILPQVRIPLLREDLTALESGEREARLREIMRQEARRPFDLTEAPLCRATLIRLDATHSQFIFHLHHIISDGWSMEILRQEFASLYQSLAAGRSVPLPPLSLDYKDFSVWHDSLLRGGGPRIEESRDFWRERFQEAVPALALPDNPTAAADSRASIYQYFIGPEWLELAKQFARRCNVPLFSVMFSLYLQLLGRFSASREILCSVIHSGREHAAFLDVVGFFVNSIPFRTGLDENEPFEAMVQRIQREVVASLRHSVYPVEKVFEECKWRYPEVQTAFNMLNIRNRSEETEITPFEPLHREEAEDGKFDIEPYFMEYKNGIVAHWLYRRSHFSKESFVFLAEEYRRMLEFFLKNPAAPYRAFREAQRKRSLKRHS